MIGSGSTRSRLGKQKSMKQFNLESKRIAKIHGMFVTVVATIGIQMPAEDSAWMFPTMSRTNCRNPSSWKFKVRLTALLDNFSVDLGLFPKPFPLGRAARELNHAPPTFVAHDYSKLVCFVSYDCKLTKLLLLLEPGTVISQMRRNRRTAC